MLLRAPIALHAHALTTVQGPLMERARNHSDGLTGAMLTG